MGLRSWMFTRRASVVGGHMADPVSTVWLKGEREAAGYCRMSLATWKKFRRRHQPQRVKLPTGPTMYRAEWLDDLLLQFAQDPAGDVNRMVDEIVENFK